MLGLPCLSAHTG